MIATGTKWTKGCANLKKNVLNINNKWRNVYATVTTGAIARCFGGGIKCRQRQSVLWSLSESRLAVQLFSCRRRRPLPPARIHAFISAVPATPGGRANSTPP